MDYKKIKATIEKYHSKIAPLKKQRDLLIKKLKKIAEQDKINNLRKNLNDSV